MADRISSFPDEILCHILSFLPTKQVVATSVLSKRWKLLWRSVFSFDFDHNPKEASSHFLHSVYSYLLWRDMDQPLHRFRLRCDSVHLNTWIKAALSGSVQHFDLDTIIAIPSMVFTCKTLVILKLKNISVEDISFVDLPLLKILHLDYIFSLEGLDLSQFLSGCPNLEVLEAERLVFKPKGKFTRLPKLVRARIHEDLLPLEVVKNVEVLFIYWISPRNLDFDFQNLVQLELVVQERKDWPEVLEVLKHCPKLQSLVICIYKINLELYLPNYKQDVRPYTESVPACVSSHLKTCCLKEYSGSLDEFEFARYIMENAKYLRTMKICTLGEKIDMIRELSSSMKNSGCTLSFE